MGSLRFRLSKLKQLKYWLGLGGIMLYFGLLVIPGLTLEAQQVKPAWGGLGMAAMLLFSFAMSWLFQGRRSGLGFTEAETELLFSAPLRQEELLHYRLARAQVGLFLSTLFIAFLTSLSWRYESFVYTWLTWYLLFNFLHIHGLLAVLVCGRWRGRWYGWPLRLGIVALLLAPAMVVYGSFPGLGAGMDALRDWATRIAGGQGVGIWLLPWVYLGKLPFVSGLWEIVPRLVALGAAWWLCYRLVLRMGVGFQERELAGAKARAEALSAARKGRLAPVSDRPVRPAWFSLAPTGALWRAIAWKNFTSLTRHVPWMLVVLLIVVVLQFVLILSAVQSSGNLRVQVGGLALGLAFFVTLAGSQFIKEDLRADLANVELLKSLPLSSLQLIRGEIYGATSILTLGVWGFVLVFALLTGGGSRSLPLLPVLWVAFSAGVILPALGLITFLVDNALALLFPAWVLPSEGSDGQQMGMEQLGRSVINLFVKMVALFAFSLLPGFFLLMSWFVASRLSFWLLPVGAGLFAFVVVLEVEMAMLWLAALFDELDPSEEGLS